MQPPVDIPWPTSSTPGERPQESAGRLINCSIEPLTNDQLKNSSLPPTKYKRTPGLTQFGDNTGRTGYRGGYVVKSLLFFAELDRFLTVDASGAVSDVASLPGDKPVTFAQNEVQPTPDVVCVTENGAFVVTTSSVANYPDPDLPQPNSVSYQDGFFFYTIGDRRAFASDINSTSVNSQTFTTIESREGGSLLRGIPFQGFMYFFCQTSCEIYQNNAASIQAPAFPYARLQVWDKGLLVGTAIAGHEPGFAEMIWVADDFGVYRTTSNSLVYEKISPPDLDRMIQNLVDKTELRAGCYQHSGRRIWYIKCLSWCWEFDVNTSKWHERSNTHQGLITPIWRGAGGTLAFNKWIMGSDVTGNLVFVDPNAFFEEGDNMQWRMESAPVGKFPLGARVGRADFDFVLGQGSYAGKASQQNPQVAISWSDDGGVTWTNPVMRQLGSVLKTTQRVFVLNPGRTQRHGRRWRIEVNDGVYVSFLGATMSQTVRAA